MREHQFDAAEAALRPKASRLDDQVTDQQGRAAAEGRPDVLGHAGLADLQRAAGNGAVSSLVGEEPSPVHDVISSGGRPLEPAVRYEPSVTGAAVDAADAASSKDLDPKTARNPHGRGDGRRAVELAGDDDGQVAPADLPDVFAARAEFFDFSGIQSGF